VLASATHTLIGTTVIRQFSNGAAMDIATLQAGAKVRVIQTRGAWDLIAEDGNVIGYVEADKLKDIEGTPAAAPANVAPPKQAGSLSPFGSVVDSRGLSGGNATRSCDLTPQGCQDTR
jgi:hypothetical protein